MQTHTPAPPPKRERRRPQISCTECRRRKQKCNFRKDGPCTNCMRRYPPVECYVQQLKNDRDSLTSKEQQKERHGLRGRSFPNANDAIISNGSKSDTDTPPISNTDDVQVKYTSIPLSRILHPQLDDSPYPNSFQQVTHDESPTLVQSSGIVVARQDVEEDDVENIPERQILKSLDPGMLEVMHKRTATGGSPRSIGGILEMLNTFNAFPVKTSLRNSELFTFYHQYVAPRLCSIDGGGFHPLFAREILPWQIQSTLMPNVAILMASATQGFLRDPTSEMSSETLVIKEHVLRLVNRFIRQDFQLVGNQAMRIVIHLVIIEWWWGSFDALWYHMEGIRQMLKLRGGFQAMNDPLNMHVLIVTDYELACGYERDLYFQTTEDALLTPLPTQQTYPEMFRCPLLPYPITFRDCQDVLGLSSEVAIVLDDIRFLTTSITEWMLDPEKVKVKAKKIKSTASWINKQVTSLLEGVISPPSAPEAPHGHEINQTILLTALIYTHCISLTIPFTQVSSVSSSLINSQFNTVLNNILLVPLSTWSSIPGIFFWILLVATPASEGDYRGRFLRKQMACTGMSIGLEDFLLGTAYLRSFWAVQVWIRREKEAETLVEDCMNY